MKTPYILIACIILISSCSNSPKGNSVSSTPDSTIKWTKLISGNQASMETPLNVVIASQQQFDSIWINAFSMDMPPDKPSVDFTKNSVIALFIGMVNNGGHSIEITGIKQSTDKGILIEADHKLPGKNCMSTMAIEYPYYLALTDVVISSKTEFTISKKETDCE